MRILIAEDEADLRNLLVEQLSEEGYQIYAAENGLDALALFCKEEIELCILDIMMPGVDGLTLVKKMRETSNIPVLFLTAKSSEADRVQGLAIGADDYVVKPFSMAELKQRVAVWKRRLENQTLCISEKRPIIEEASLLTCGAIRLDPSSGRAYRGSEELICSAKEFKLLQFFLENQGKLLTKKQLYHAVWEEEYVYDDNTIMVHISHLRNKIEINPKEPKYLTTFRGIGYKLEVQE